MAASRDITPSSNLESIIPTVFTDPVAWQCQEEESKEEETRGEEKAILGSRLDWIRHLRWALGHLGPQNRRRFG